MEAVVPEELQMEVLLRMPLKTLAKSICVSKKWASIIRSKQFKDLYLLRSMKRPRVLFVDFPGGSDVLLHSVYQEEKPSLSSGQQQMLLRLDRAFGFSHPIQGLVCLQWDNKVVICNPGGKKVLTDFTSYPKITAFLGYDQNADVFKVLCMTKSVCDDRSKESYNYQVFTVGSGEESWRRIGCKRRHTPGELVFTPDCVFRTILCVVLRYSLAKSQKELTLKE